LFDTGVGRTKSVKPVMLSQLTWGKEKSENQLVVGISERETQRKK